MYHSYGLNIKSDFPLSLYKPINSTKSVDISFERAGQAEEVAHLWHKRIEQNGDTVKIRIKEVGLFEIRSASRVLVYPFRDTPDEKIVLYLQGTIISVILHLRDLLPIHGASFTIDGRGCLFIGDSGAGKSTLSAFAAVKGEYVYADDLSALEKNGAVLPGAYKVKLWRDATEKLGISLSECPQLCTDIDKYLYRVPQTEYQRPLKIEFIFVLSSSPSQNDHPLVMSKADTVNSVLTHRHRPGLFNKLALHKAQFDCVNALCQDAQAFHITRPVGENSLETLWERAQFAIALSEASCNSPYHPTAQQELPAND